MARWYRSGRYYGRNRGYYRRRGGGSSNRKSYGNMKAAKQQADQSTFTINIPTSISCFSKKSTNIQGNDGLLSDQVRGVRAINIYDLLRKSDFYKSYAAMYDEFKVDKIKVKLLPTEFIYTASSGENARYKNVTVYTAWDRTGLSKDQIYINAGDYTDTAAYLGNVDPSNPGESNQSGIYCIVGEDITTYSSAESRVINPGTNTQIVRWLNPKTMYEKSQWLSTGILKDWYGCYNDKLGCFQRIATGRINSNMGGTSAEGDFEQIELQEIKGPWLTTSYDPNHPEVVQTPERTVINYISNANSSNPCYLLEDSGFGFKPTLLVGVYPTSTGDNTVKFNVEAEVVCTFRGLRKAKVVAA